ncbi:helix-turn-helix domain-containing protein [Chryseobacterium zhengzhouense]|uniref:Helix-turn-helix domain-containing protein n=1 Tax=Chryseobacterium zhengzhouense TaxID=1636086 RepID=A0ABW2LXF7_9FLAO
MHNNIIFYKLALNQSQVNIKLRKIREKNNISQQKMASKLNISQSQYYRKEANIIGFTDKEWQTIATFMQIDLDELKEKHSKTLNKYSSTSTFKTFVNISEKLIQELEEHNKTLKEIIIIQKEQIITLSNKLQTKTSQSA